MYSSIPDKLSNQDLTTVVHFVVKMINKYKNIESREIRLNELPVTPTIELLPICNNLMQEIGIEKLGGNNSEIDRHIKQLFEILDIRLSSELNQMNTQAKHLMTKFRTEE